MRAAYVDSSCLVSLAFDEPGASEISRCLTEYDELFSSPLLEAEVRSALVREGIGGEAELLSWVTWVLPARPLSFEISVALGVGYLRGADLWHLACALYLAPTPRELGFATADRRQAEVATKLGFEVPPLVAG